MAAPKLTFDKEEEEEKKSAIPPPRLSFAEAVRLKEEQDRKKKGGVRDPKKHSIFSNAWAGIQSIPRSVLEQEEEARHAIASDIGEGHGLFGFVTTPLHTLGAAGKYAVTGSKKDKAAIKEALTNPWEDERSAFDVVAEKTVKDTYETTRRATGTRGSKKFKEIWHDNPVAALGGVAILAPPVARLAGISKMAKEIKAVNRVPVKPSGKVSAETLKAEGGDTRPMTMTEAVKAATVESYYPGTLDKLGIKGSPFSPRKSGRRVSRGPTGRAAQKAFDWGSEKIDEGIGVGSRKTGPDTPLSATRREAAGKRRADDLNRGRLVTNAMRYVSTFADYLNAGESGRVSTVARMGTALGRRKTTLESRDAAVGAALHASTAIDPVDAVRHAADDTKAILESGRRDAHNGDIGDVEEGKRLGQIVYVTHGLDEDGNPVREKSTVISDDDGRVTVTAPDGSERTIPHGRAHLLGPDGEGDIPLHEDEVMMLTRRAALLDTAHEELVTEPRLEAKFRAAVQSMSDLGQMNEQLGEDFFMRGMDPTGSEALALQERLTARRNQFVPRTGGEGVEAIDYDAGLWGDLQKTMEKAGIPDEQQYLFLTAMDHAARVWANEVEGRTPADYLSSPEGKNLGGIDFSHPEDLEATVNAMFQREGERNHLVKTTTTVLITADPKVGDLVSTPKGMGFVHEITTGSEGNVRIAWIDMNEGGNFREAFPLDQVRLSNFPWRGNPQVNDYVMTPEGVGRLDEMDHGPAPDFKTTYTVTLFDTLPGGMFVDGESKTFQGGEVLRIENPRHPEADTEANPIFHINAQKALGGPKFPTKGTVEQYKAAFKEAGVKAEEFYWMGLSAFPVLEAEVVSARALVASVEKKMVENPDALFKYHRPGILEPVWIPGDELLAIRRPQRDAAEARLASYTEEPDPDFILDMDWGGKSFPVQVVRDMVDSRAHFLDLKEHLYSSKAAGTEWRDRWGPGRNGAEGSSLIIKEPTYDEPYYELVMALPKSELFRAGHYPIHGEESPVVHIRFHEITDNEGVKSLLRDEGQSDWNNQGRLHGFREILPMKDKRQAAKLRDKERRLNDLYARAETELGMGLYDVNNWFDNQIDDMARVMNEEIDVRNAVKTRAMEAARDRFEDVTGPEFAREPRLYTYGEDRNRIQQRLMEERANDPEFGDMLKARRRFERLNEKRTSLRVAADAIETGGGSSGAINRGPLVMGDNARYLILKRMIRWAADHGQTRIIWTRGHEQGVRYSKYDDLPVHESYDEYGDSDPGHPSDHGDDFYYRSGDTRISIGGHYRTSDVSPEKLHRMQQAQPIEVRYDDLDEYGGDYVLLPNGHPADTGGEVQVPGQMSLEEEGMFVPYAGAARNERWAKVVREMDDGVVAQPIDPKWDPAKVNVEYRSNTGGDSYGTFDVEITNRLGETLYRSQVEGSIGDHSDLLAEVKKDWERVSRYQVGGYRESLDPDTSTSQENLANDSSSTPLGTNAEKMNQLLDILDQSDTFQSEFDYMLQHADYELDEDSWHEYVQQHTEENEERNAGRGHGAFEEIRDYDAPGKRRARNLTEGIATLERQRALDVERGVMSRDYDTEIRNMRLELDRIKRNVENQGHDAGYDEMDPKMAERLLKPYRKEPDYRPVEIKEEIYRGRYAIESRGGVVSEEGDIHGWVMDLPKKMLEDAKNETDSLFQRGNDIIKGASTWVGGPDGQRFIALTEHADFSTLMHEFIGHAADEMKRRYPELWEAVETDMGLPLEKWKTSHHEKFAKYVERYWMEGKAPSPELVTMMRMVKEWMKGVYSSITMLGKPMPDSTRILLNRHLGQGVTARPGARTYVPHISQFDTLLHTAPGGTRLSAGDNVIGRNLPDKRNFGARRNRGILWQSGELALSARPIVDQYFRRTKFMETEAVRQEMFDEGHPMPKNGRVPEGAWLVRNPETAPERLTARNKSKLSEEDFSRLIGEGDTPDEFVTKMEEIRKDHYAEPGEHPEWANDLENVRWVEGGKIKARIQNVFPSAPRGRVAASAGSLNSMARLTGIYLRPLHYLVGNIPQNVIMVALTNPSALVNATKYGAYSFLPRVVREMAVQPRDLFAHDRHLYNRIKTETGDIQAGAGLPDFYTLANNRFQKGERRLNKISQGSAEKLGELADQPYRISVWIAHAKNYGYNTPDEWTKLLDSERGTPEARIRDDIAQSTREDMIDFNTLSPGERQNVSRFFYLWAFTRGFAKWPVTFAREYPGRTGLALTTADPAQEDDNGIPTSWLPSSGTMKMNKGPGKVRDLGFLDPTGGLRQQIETGIQVAHGNFSGIGGMTTPPLETGIQAITGGPRAPKGGLGGLVDQLARDTVPFWDIGKKAATPGLKISERVERVLDFHDRFGVKPEIGRGKNSEKKRKEDEQIRRTLTQAERLEVLPLVMHQQDAYWHHKYMEQQIRFGAQARRKGTALTDEEKLVILYATAADYFPQAELPALTDALKESSAYQEMLREELRDAMFGGRNEVVNAG